MVTIFIITIYCAVALKACLVNFEWLINCSYFSRFEMIVEKHFNTLLEVDEKKVCIFYKCCGSNLFWVN